MPQNEYENQVYQSILKDNILGGVCNSTCNPNMLLGVTDQNLKVYYFSWSNWGYDKNVKDSKYLVMRQDDGTWTSTDRDTHSHVLCVRHLISTFEFKPISTIPQVFFEPDHLSRTYEDTQAVCSEVNDFTVLSFDNMQFSIDFAMTQRISGVYHLEGNTHSLRRVSNRAGFRNKGELAAGLAVCNKELISPWKTLSLLDSTVEYFLVDIENTLMTNDEARVQCGLLDAHLPNPVQDFKLINLIHKAIHQQSRQSKTRFWFQSNTYDPLSFSEEITCPSSKLTAEDNQLNSFICVRQNLPQKATATVESRLEGRIGFDWDNLQTTINDHFNVGHAISTMYGEITHYGVYSNTVDMKVPMPSTMKDISKFCAESFMVPIHCYSDVNDEYNLTYNSDDKSNPGISFFKYSQEGFPTLNTEGLAKCQYSTENVYTADDRGLHIQRFDEDYTEAEQKAVCTGIGLRWMEPSNLKTVLMSDEFYSYSYGMTQYCSRKLKKASRFLCYDEMFKFRQEKRSIKLDRSKLYYNLQAVPLRTDIEVECDDSVPGSSWLTIAFKPSDSAYRSFKIRCQPNVKPRIKYAILNDQASSTVHKWPGTHLEDHHSTKGWHSASAWWWFPRGSIKHDFEVHFNGTGIKTATISTKFLECKSDHKMVESLESPTCNKVTKIPILNLNAPLNQTIVSKSLENDYYWKLRIKLSR